MGRVDGKVAIVTGATSGLGEAIARLLASEGARVLAAGLSAPVGRQAEHKNCRPIRFDVSSEDAWRNVVDFVVESYGALNILVNCAGIGDSDGSMEMTFAAWRRILAVNLDGTFLGTKYAIEAMRNTRSTGSIINIGSVMARVGNKYSAAYCASKGGVSALTRAAAMYCTTEKLPIRVNAILPGMCATPLVVQHFENRSAEELEVQYRRHPVGHLGDPDDIARAALYLASDESKFVVGSELVVDGGFLASDGIPMA